MKTRRAYIIGLTALGLTFTAMRGATHYTQAADSARNFRHYFADLKTAGSDLNPVERVVYSLLLTSNEEGNPDCAKPSLIRAATPLKSATTRM
jgi:hypothetical protein